LGPSKAPGSTGWELGMKESSGEGPASRPGLEPYAGHGHTAGVASARGSGRPAVELRNHPFRVPTVWWLGKATRPFALFGQRTGGTAESQNLCMPAPAKETSSARTGRSCWFPQGARGFFPTSLVERSENVSDGQADRHANRKSDESVVPVQRSNTAGTQAAEAAEGRDSPERNAPRSLLVPDSEPDTARHREAERTAGSAPSGS
jgi:hypothetical protein